MRTSARIWLLIIAPILVAAVVTIGLVIATGGSPTELASQQSSETSPADSAAQSTSPATSAPYVPQLVPQEVALNGLVAAPSSGQYSSDGSWLNAPSTASMAENPATGQAADALPDPANKLPHATEADSGAGAEDNTDTGGAPSNASTVQATDDWALDLAPGADPQAIAAELGIEYVGPVGTLQGVHLFRVPDSATDPQAAQAIQERLAARSDVQGVAQQFARDLGTRPVPSDPAFPSQWHLQNSGQTGGPAGEDANVTPAWNAGFTGSGVVIGVVDDGLQHAHPDLAPNYLSAPSYDFNDNDPDPAPANLGPENPGEVPNPLDVQVDEHGTSVAGVAAAADDGASCGVGAAYDANLAGLRLLGAPVTDAQEASALTYAYNTIDVYNNSWGPADSGAAQGPGPLAQQALADGITNGRSGLGNIYVWAAGNGLLSGDNVNADGYANSIYTIAVGALNNLGQEAFYSEPGAAMVVTAHSSGNGVGITTTDLLGSFGQPGDCTNVFGGTSSSAPLVSGIVALMLQANPDLTWRDVQHILIETAVQNDLSDSDWTSNGAGYLVNHKYGFGRVDAAAAVALAQTWESVSSLDYLSYDSGVIPVNQSIPDANRVGVTSRFIVTEDMNLEHVEVVFNATHPYRGDLAIILTSPSGTQSILMNQRFTDPNADYDNWRMMSVRDWGESPVGTWTIQVVDLAGGDAGTFDSWQLILHGTPAEPAEPIVCDFNVGDGDVHGLVWALDEANDLSGDEERAVTVCLAEGGYYNVTNKDNNADGPTALPVIRAEVTLATPDEDNSGSIDRAVIYRSGNKKMRLLNVNANGVLWVRNVELYGGYLTDNYYGAGLFNRGTTTLENVFLHDNRTARDGAGVYNRGELFLTRGTVISENEARSGGGLFNQGTVSAENCTIENNTASQRGAALYNSRDGNLTIDTCTVKTSNASLDGGGLYNEGTAVAANCAFEGNTSNRRGAALYNSRDAELTVDGCSVSDSEATKEGGGLYNLGTTTGNNCAFENNTAGERGAALYNSRATLELTACAVSGNDAHMNGAGLYNTDPGSTATMDSVVFSDNTTEQRGAALYNSRGTVLISNSSFNQNDAANDGGALFNASNSSVVVDKSFFTQNSSTERGAALYNSRNAGLSVTGTTFVENQAGQEGGAIYNESTETEATFNCFIDNSGTSVFSQVPMDVTNSWWNASDGPSGSGGGEEACVECAAFGAGASVFQSEGERDAAVLSGRHGGGYNLPSPSFGSCYSLETETFTLTVTNNGGAGYIGYKVYGEQNSVTNLGYFEAGQTRTFSGITLLNGDDDTLKKYVSSNGSNWQYVSGTHVLSVEGHIEHGYLCAPPPPPAGGSGDSVNENINFGAFQQNRCVTDETQIGNIVIELVVESESEELPSFDFTDSVEKPNAFSLFDGESQSFLDIATGSYTVQLTDPMLSPGGYVLSNLVCTGDDYEGTESTVSLVARRAVIGLDSGETVTCTFTVTEVPNEPENVCNTETPWALEWANYEPGAGRYYHPVDENRQHPENALGEPELTDTLNFVSLGRGGSLELSFGGAAIYDGEGDDFQVWETSYGKRGLSCWAYPEKIRVEATQDGETWVPLDGYACRDGSFDLATGDLEWAVAIRLIDITRHNWKASDGYDVDGLTCVGYDDYYDEEEYYALAPAQADLVRNGDLLSGTDSWEEYVDIEAERQMLLQHLDYATLPGAPFEVTVDLSSSDNAAQDVTVRLYNGSYSGEDITCVFNLDGQSSGSFVVRGLTQSAWDGIMLEVSAATDASVSLESAAVEFTPGAFGVGQCGEVTD